MKWFLIISYLNTNDVDMQSFNSYVECQDAQIKLFATLPPNPAIEKIECLEGREIER